jgi:hypothetical protein
LRGLHRGAGRGGERERGREGGEATTRM